MKKKLFKLLVYITVLQIFLTVQASCKSNEESSLVNSKRDMVLWYKHPGVQWLEGLPIGNGYMGAMVFGRIQNERIALNETTFWSGRPNDYTNPDGYKYFPAIRDLVFAGEYKEAEKIADEHFFGIPVNQQAFQPLGDLLLNFKNSENVAVKYSLNNNYVEKRNSYEKEFSSPSMHDISVCLSQFRFLI